MKLRFLLHSVYGTGGGVARVALNLVDELKSRHDVEVVSLFRQRTVPQHALPSGVPVTVLVDARRNTPEGAEVPAERRAAEARPSRLLSPHENRFPAYTEYSDSQLERYLTSLQDGVVIGMQPGMMAAIAQLAPRSVVRVGQEHRSIRGRSKSLLADVLPHYAALDLFLTLTERDAAVYRTRYLPRTRVEAMPNGIPEYVGTVSDGTDKVVVAAGRLLRSKGFDRLLDAWAVVVREHPDWQLRIYGKGQEQDELARQIEALSIGSSASLMGYSTRIREEMAEASIFVLSSRAEGYPMVILEAMSCGLPVVAFDCPTGPREIIDHGSDGLLVPNDDVEGLAAAISSLIGSGVEGRRSMGQAAVRKAHEHSQPNISARWEALLQPMVDAKAAG